MSTADVGTGAAVVGATALYKELSKDELAGA